MLTQCSEGNLVKTVTTVENLVIAVVDPGFPIGGAWTHYEGHGPLTWVLFSENACENKRIGSHRGWCAPGMPPPLDPPKDSHQ